MTSRSPALERLDALVGEWTLEGSVPTDPSFTARGWTSFEWLAGGFFLVQRWGNEVPEFPDGIAIIGWIPQPTRSRSTTTTRVAYSASTG